MARSRSERDGDEPNLRNAENVIDADVGALGHGIRDGILVVGVEFSYWRAEPDLWLEGTDPRCHMIDIEAGVGFLHSTTRERRVPENIQPILASAGRRLARGEARVARHPSESALSAHQQAALAQTLGKAARIRGVPLMEVFSPWLDPHLLDSVIVLWRTPAGQPDAVFLVDTCRHRSAVRRFRPIALAAL